MLLFFDNDLTSITHVSFSFLSVYRISKSTLSVTRAYSADRTSVTSGKPIILILFDDTWAPGLEEIVHS